MRIAHDAWQCHFYCFADGARTMKNYPENAQQRQAVGYKVRQMIQTYKVTLSYDGTDYNGWQKQPGKPTIQGFLEQAVEQIVQRKTPVIGAGRTDAGVHALGQVAHFKASVSLNENEFFQALNALLPKDIRITALEKAAPDFHSRKMAQSKLYQYRIFTSRFISPFLIRYVLHWTQSLDEKAMEKAASLFEREADFSAFSSNRHLNPIRKVTRSEIQRKKDELIYTIEAKGFLRYMVRTIVGTLLEIGKGKIAPEDVKKLFQEKKRSLASPTAPPHGLCLIKVTYPPTISP